MTTKTTKTTTNKTETLKRQKCEVYSRPVGYLRTVSSWNDAKKEEFTDRRTYGRVASSSSVSATC